MSRIFRVEIEGDVYEVIVDELTGGAGRRPLSRENRGAAERRPLTPVSSKRAASERQKTGSGEVRAMMAGAIVEVFVEEGQHVEAGEALMILEAMKMENQVVASKSGTVRQLNVKKGCKVNDGEMLCVIE